MFTTLAFYLFSAILLGSAAAVVSSRNPVHSVLFLILAFFNAAALFLIAGAEFLAMILVIVYVGAVLLVELVLVLGGWRFAPEANALRLTTMPGGVTNTHALGRLIYTDYVLLFQVAGLILMVAMIGAIVLTHRERNAVKRQDIGRQTSRRVGDTLAEVRVPLGAGMKETGIYRPKPEPALVAADQPHEHGVGKPGPGEH